MIVKLITNKGINNRNGVADDAIKNLYDTLVLPWLLVGLTK